MTNINSQIRNGDYIDNAYPELENFAADLVLNILEEPKRMTGGPCRAREIGMKYQAGLIDYKTAIDALVGVLNV